MSRFVMEGITKTIVNGDVDEELLKGISLSLERGEITALVGASGSGKSTLLTIAAGLQSTTEGVIRFEGADMTAMNQDQLRALRAKSFGFVFQSAHLVPFLTVEEQLRLMLGVAEVKLKKIEREDVIEEMLASIGMRHRRKAYPSSLSGGERQRVAVARAIIHQPDILFADEPTASLDSSKSKEVMALIRALTKGKQITTLMVTHDPEMLPFVDRTISMQDGLI